MQNLNLKIKKDKHVATTFDSLVTESKPRATADTHLT